MTNDELERLREFRAGIAPPDDETRRTIYAHATHDEGGRRYRLPSVALAAVAVAAGVALLLVSPWSGNGGLVQRALAAVGTGEVLHVVFTQQEEGASQAVSLPSGAALPAPTLQTEIWYDQSRSLEKAVESLPNGDVLGQSVETPQADYDSAGQITNELEMENGQAVPYLAPASLEPALTDFVDEYQSALSSGQATQTGTGQVDGHDVIWLHIAADPKDYYPAMDVAIDASTYAPVQIRTDDENPAQIDVSEIDTQAYDPSLFTPPPVTSTVSSSTGTPTPIDASQAPGILGGQAVWLGQSWNGYQLTSVQQEQVTDGYAQDTGKPPVQSVAVVFTYTAGTDVLQIQEASQCTMAVGCGAAAPTDGVLILGQGPIPDTTKLNGVYVAISQTGGSADPVAVANALQSMTR